MRQDISLPIPGSLLSVKRTEADRRRTFFVPLLDRLRSSSVLWSKSALCSGKQENLSHCFSEDSEAVAQNPVSTSHSAQFLNEDSQERFDIGNQPNRLKCPTVSKLRDGGGVDVDTDRFHSGRQHVSDGNTV